MQNFSEAELDIAYNKMISLLDSLSYDTLHMGVGPDGRAYFLIEIGNDEIEVALTHLDTVSLTAAAAAIISRAEVLASVLPGNATLH